MRMIDRLLLATMLLGLDTPATAQTNAGKSAFNACAACHGVSPGANGMGPSLFSVVGHKAGAVPGYAYSPAFRKLVRTWTPAELNAFLKAPAASVPGTKMYFGGISDDARRAAVIGYLTTLK